MVRLHTERGSPRMSPTPRPRGARAGLSPVGTTDLPTIPTTSGHASSGRARRRMISFIASIALVPILSGPARAVTHHGPEFVDSWPRAAALIRQPDVSAGEIVRAARLDLAARAADADASSMAFAHWLGAAVSDPDIDLEAARGAEILRSFVMGSAGDGSRFWAAFSLANFQRLAGDEAAVAATLERALRFAAAEEVPSEIVAKTRGIMGHAQQGCGMLERARETFDSLLDYPDERAHAMVHLGEIALFTSGVEAGVRIWLSHPDGPEAALAVIADEADLLWISDPERSYRLVAETLARVAGSPGPPNAAGIERAVARLKARSRKNAARP